MGIGKNTENNAAGGTGKLQEELKKAKAQQKEQELKSVQLEQLTWLNKELLQKLKSAEQSHLSLMKYIEEMHRSLEDNFHRTPIEEIWYRELGSYLKGMGKKK